MVVYPVVKALWLYNLLTLACVVGQLVPIDITYTMHTVSAKLKPRKVLFLNTTGGFTDEHDEVGNLSQK